MNGFGLAASGLLILNSRAICARLLECCTGLRTPRYGSRGEFESIFVRSR